MYRDEKLFDKFALIHDRYPPDIVVDVDIELLYRLRYDKQTPFDVW